MTKAAILEYLTNQRNLLDRAIAAVASLGDLEPEPATLDSRVSAWAAAAVTDTHGTDTNDDEDEVLPAPPRLSQGVPNVRERALLTFLRLGAGFASSKELRKAMPHEPDLTTPKQRGDAFRNTVYKLKQKGQIGRTGDTWSLVTLEA